MRHKLVSLFRRGVEAHWIVYLVGFLEGHLLVAAIDGRRGRKHELRDFRRVAAALEDVEKAFEVCLLVDEGVGYRIPYSRLRGEVEDNVRRRFREQGFKPLKIADVKFARGEARELFQDRRAVALELHVVVVAEVVDADDLPSAAQKFARCMEAYEAGKTSDQYFHLA